MAKYPTKAPDRRSKQKKEGAAAFRRRCAYKQMKDIPQSSFTVSGQFLSNFALELLEHDATDLVQIAAHDGYLVKVLPPEQDFGDGPHEIQTLIGLARKEEKEWLYINQIPTAVRHQYLRYQ